MDVFLTTLYAYHLLKYTETINFVYILSMIVQPRQTLLLKTPKFLGELSSMCVCSNGHVSGRRQCWNVSPRVFSSNIPDKSGLYYLMNWWDFLVACFYIVCFYFLNIICIYIHSLSNVLKAVWTLIYLFIPSFLQHGIPLSL